ncbi:prolyl oligopeptidase family serine peptidase [Kitasatospora hibisci]|uniref:prolyl oligopeptidase family serine peptidase n=1 Tax=Kitasatospora hibisci TaxID=3369522 RepID=UPI0037541C97
MDRRRAGRGVTRSSHGHPAAEPLDLCEDLGGVRVPDPYRWLEDAETSATRAWRRAQRDLFAAERQRWDSRRHFARVLPDLLPERLNLATVSRGRREFFWRLDRRHEHPVLMVAEEGTERVLADPAALDASGSLVITAWHPSVEGNLLALQFARGGRETGMLCVIDVATGQVVDKALTGIRNSGVAWAPGGSTFYYVGQPLPSTASMPGSERAVMRHRVGTPQSADTVVRPAAPHAAGPYSVAPTVGDRWLVVTSADADRPDRRWTWLADLAGDPVEPALRRVALPDAQIRAVREDGIYILTTHSAPNGSIHVADVRSERSVADPTAWREIVPESPEEILEDFVVLQPPDRSPAALLVHRRRHAASRLALHRLDSGEHVQEIPLPGYGDVRNLRNTTEPIAALEYSDHASSVRTLHYVPGRPRPSVLEPGTDWLDGNSTVMTTHVEYTSSDGTAVPLRIVSRVGRPRTSAPTVLSVYGGFGVTQAPEYAPGIRAWVEAGGVFAIAGVRGGGENGVSWHRSGRRENKQNTFDDVIAAGRYLVAQGWCTKAQLGLHGASNGGLTVGAVLVQQPGLFRAAVCAAPLLDMVRYERLGRGATWSSEYGSASVPEELSWLLSYSPYHQVTQGTAYPAVLFSVFNGDDRVDPAHARKMCAAMQRATSSGARIILREEDELGHGLRTRTAELSHTADMLAFLATELGLRVPPTPQERDR